MQKKYYQRIIILLLCTFLLSGCHDKKNSLRAQKEKIMVATLATPVQRLYFTGTLSPIKTFPVISPVAGNILHRYFTYGDRVEKNQKLLIIDSKPLADHYRKAVSTFFQKKQSYNSNQNSFVGEQALYHAGVVSKNDYATAKTALDNAALDYLQARYALETVLKTAHVDSKKIESLSIADTDKVNALLEQHFRNIEIMATGSGVALFPKKDSDDNTSSSSSSSSFSGKLMQGSEIKEGQLLLSIGDLSGLSASFDVSEVDIDLIHKNMPVMVTGSAFPGVTLKGIVTAVSSQANQNSGESGLSMFSVKIDIPHVDEKIMEKIRVGMTAKFEVDIKATPHIMLPVNAVFEKNGKSMVTILDAQGKPKTVSVITGDTTPTQVVIISGIRAGDKVVINASAS